VSKALLVIDMLNGFCVEGRPLYCGEDARKIIPFVVRKVQEFRRRGDAVIFVGDRHDPDDDEFKLFPPHCIRGTSDADVIEELQSYLEGAVFIPKTRYSAFYRTDLDEKLRELAPEEVAVVGVCTNICVLYTVEELRNRGYRTVVYEAGVASFGREAHDFALKQMETVLGARIERGD